DADTVFTYGRAGDVTLTGDWDGNGTDTLAVQRGRTYYVNNSLRGGDADTVLTFGRLGDEVHVGDWNGDGTDTLGVRRPVGQAPATATATGAKEVTSAAKVA
ncbi:alkaline phosphatase, partial [Georgenia satyanarayanai]